MNIVILVKTKSLENDISQVGNALYVVAKVTCNVTT